MKPERKRRLLISLFALSPIGCGSAMVIKTSPPESRVIVDGEVVGKAPVSFTNHKAIFTTTRVSIRKEGYRGLDTTIRKSGSWGFRYAPEYLFTLQPLPHLDTSAAKPGTSGLSARKKAGEAEESHDQANSSSNMAPVLVFAGIGVFLGIWWLTYAIAPSDSR
jgi:hypothetical protein